MTTGQEITLTSVTGAAGSGGAWGSMRERIEQEIHRPGGTNQIQIAMITAMNWYKHEPFWFNEATHTFTLTNDQQSYPQEDGGANTAGWPVDIERIVDTYVLVGNERWLKMAGASIDDVRWLTPTDEVVGVPSYYAWFDEKIWLTPIPNASTSTQIRIDYIQDVGIPTYSWTGSAWAFYAPPAFAPLADDFSNRWLAEAEVLIRTRAKYDLYLNYYDDQENAEAMYGASLEAMGQLRSRVNARTAETPRQATRI